MKTKPTYTNFRDFLKWLMQQHPTRTFVLILILLNAATLGMETSPTLVAEYGTLLHYADRIIIGFFIVEILFRIIGMGPGRFFSDRWSVFDFIVVAIALVPSGAELSILRTLRILRVLRLISVIPAMRRVVNGLIASISGVLSVASILLIIFYIFAVISTTLYADYSDEYFGSIGRSMFTLFQVMTLASWTELVRELMRTHPYSWVFFIFFILISTFTMLNLLVGVMVNTMENVAHIEEEGYQGVDRRKRFAAPPDGAERRKQAHHNAAATLLTEVRLHATEHKLAEEIAALRKQMVELKELLAKR